VFKDSYYHSYHSTFKLETEIDMASVWKHPKSRYWTACFTDKDGKQRKRSTKTTDKHLAREIAQNLERAETQAKENRVTTVQLQKVLRDLSERVTGDCLNTPTAREYLRDWLRSKETRIQPSSHLRYSTTAKQFLNHIGKDADRPITGITPMHVESFLLARIENGAAPKTAIADIKTLNNAFLRAEKFGIILKNPVAPVDLPKDVSSERDIFTPEQVGRLLDAVARLPYWTALILLGYFTGARLGDCVRLKWKDFDEKRRVFVLKQKKTGKDVVLPVHMDLFEHLNFLDEFIESDEDYICGNLVERASGGKHGLSESFNRIVKRAGIDPQNIQGKGKRRFNRLSFHSLRHSFNSILANAGVSQEVRMRLTGHSSIGMNNRYTRLNVDPLRDAIDTIPTLDPE
jgi:integrase